MLTADSIRIGKLEAASRQLDAAIRLLFAGEDIVAVHTLAGAASGVLTDLVEHRAPDKSWDTFARDANKLDPTTYRAIKNRTQNFLKHADRDPDGEHEFPTAETTAIIMNAVMNIGELAGPLNMTQSVYQLWFLACNIDVLPSDAEIRPYAKNEFGNLSRRTMTYRLSVGRRVLDDVLKGRREGRF
jgi:hypothetical protein